MELHPILEENVCPSSSIWYVVSALGDRPSLRVGHTAVYAKAEDIKEKGHVFILGGANPSETFSDVHTLDLTTLSWNMSSPDGFKPRYEHLSYIPSSKPDQVYVLSGANQESNLNEIQAYSTKHESWTTVRASGTAPVPRTHHTTAAIDDCAYIFSGGKSGAEPVQDRQLYCFNALTDSWSSPTITGELPPPRHGHSLCVYGSKLICFGGMAATKFYNDLYVLDLAKNSWSCPKVKKRSVPEARAAHAAVIHDKFMYVFGGMNKEGIALDDLWKLDLGTFTWTQVTIEGPPPPSRLDMASCIIRWKWNQIDSLEDDAVADKLKESLTVSEKTSSSSKASGDAGAAAACSGKDDFCHMLFIHGGMDTQGEIFDDCLVIKLD